MENKFKVGDRVEVRVFSYINTGTVVGPSPTNLGHNVYVLLDDEREPQNIASGWLRHLTPLEELL